MTERAYSVNIHPMLISVRSRRAFLITALQDVEAWQRLVAHGGFVVDQRLEAPMGLDGESAAAEGTVVLVLKQAAAPAESRRRAGGGGWPAARR